MLKPFELALDIVPLCYNQDPNNVSWDTSNWVERVL